MHSFSAYCNTLLLLLLSNLYILEFLTLNLHWDPTHRRRSDDLQWAARWYTALHCVCSCRALLWSPSVLPGNTSHRAPRDSLYQPDSPDETDWLQGSSDGLWLTKLSVQMSPVSADSRITDTVSFPSLLLNCYLYIWSRLLIVGLIVEVINYFRLFVCLATQKRPQVQLNGDRKLIFPSWTLSLWDCEEVHFNCIPASSIHDCE